MGLEIRGIYSPVKGQGKRTPALLRRERSTDSGERQGSSLQLGVGGVELQGHHPFIFCPQGPTPAGTASTVPENTALSGAHKNVFISLEIRRIK